MGSNKSGFDNENELITELNNKRVNELNSNLKNFIYFLFYDLDGNERISAYTGISGQKPDIIIKINNEIKNVSVKIGNGNKEVFYSASYHGNEWITSTVLMKFLADYCYCYKNNLLLIYYKRRPKNYIQ